MREPTIENLVSAGWERVRIEYQEEIKIIDLKSANKKDEEEWFIAMHKPQDIGEYYPVLCYVDRDNGQDECKLNMKRTNYFDGLTLPSVKTSPFLTSFDK